MQSLFDTIEVESPGRYVLRDYQAEFARAFVRLVGGDCLGVLDRCFTGGGKTLMASHIAAWWLGLGDDYRVMVLTYEIDLCRQFANEIEKWIGIKPVQEQGVRRVKGVTPQIVVACRQSLKRTDLATQEQRDFLLGECGIDDPRLLTKSAARKLINAARRGTDVEIIRDHIRAANEHPHANHEEQAHSRLFKFDWRLNWLLVFDEAHRHAYHLQTVKHIVDWFEKNPKSRRLGITATPQRGDGKTIERVFPGIALDLPLYSHGSRNAVCEGWAVPYRQVYVSVEGVDFAKLKQVKGDFDADELERALDTEENLAKLCVPLLDLCDNRLTLIFSPTVRMAKDVEDWLNARCKCQCFCGEIQWHPKKLIGDGAACRQCKRLLETQHVLCDDDVADSLDGSIPAEDRETVHKDFKAGRIQFLSVCGLCREGYDNPNIGCVAIFQPISKKAAGLAEQMKGRGARPLPGVVDGPATAEARREAIAASVKPDCLIVDLVGTSGLPNCATTLQIYAGVPTEVLERAQELLFEATGGMEVTVAIKMATEQVEARREAARQWRAEQKRLSREAAEKRAKLDAQVDYSTTVANEQINGLKPKPIYRDGKRMASDGQIGKLWHLGFRDIRQYDRPTMRVACRMIDQFSEGSDVGEVKRTNRLLLKSVAFERRIGAIDSHDGLTDLAREIRDDRALSLADRQHLYEAGKRKRQELNV